MENKNNDQIDVVETDFHHYAQFDFDHNKSVFTHHLWIDSFSNSNTKKIYLLIRDKKKVFAKIAGLHIKNSHLYGDELFFYSSPQFEAHNGFDNKKLFNALLNYAKRNKFNRLVVSSYDCWHNCIEPMPEVYLNHREDYVFDLTLTEPHQIHNTRFKKNYKKALRVHPSLVENSNDEGLTNLINLLRTTHNIRLKKNYDDYKLFYMPHTNEQQLRHILDNQLGKIYEVRVDNQVHAVALNLESNNSVFALFMAYNEFAYKNGLAAFFIYNLIDLYRSKGFTRYNFGGIPEGKDNQGIRVFKESIGTRAVQLNGMTTNFLQYPHKLMNPTLNLIRHLKRVVSQ